jgi:hypothetical protein
MIIGLPLGLGYMIIGLLSRSQYAPESPSVSEFDLFSVVFSGPGAEAGLVAKTHISFHVHRATLQILTSDFQQNRSPHDATKIPC